MSADAGFDVVVGADGGIAPEELARHGVRSGAHLRIMAQVERPPDPPGLWRVPGTTP